MRSGPAFSARPGVVLLATVLLVVVAGLVLATTIVLAQQAALVARARADALRARIAAASAVRSAFAGWPVPAVRGLSLLQEAQLPEVLSFGAAEGRASVRRLGGDAYLLLGSGRAGLARGNAVALVHVLSVRSFLVNFPAAIAATGGRLGPAARVGTAPADAPPAPWSAAACDRAAGDSLQAVFGVAPRPGVLAPADALVRAGADVQGEPPILDAYPEVDSLGLGPLPWDALPSWADRVEALPVSLAPTTRDGACDVVAPGNWGAPLDPRSPCADYLPLVYAPGDLRVLGGAGQGVLVVRGNLELAEDARFYGAIFVAGSAHLATGVTVRGALRAGTVHSEADVEYSACAVLRALEAAPGLGRPFRQGRLWLPAF